MVGFCACLSCESYSTSCDADGSGAVSAGSADSRWVVTGNSDNTARLWLLQMNALVDLARSIIGRNFFADEWQRNGQFVSSADISRREQAKLSGGDAAIFR